MADDRPDPVNLDPFAVGRVCLCLAVRKAARSVARRYDEAFRPFGITSGQFTVLMGIAAERPIGMARLAEELGMDRTSLIAALKPLERDGFVERREDPRNARQRHFRLTAKGRDVLDATLPVWTRTQEALMAHVAPADIDLLRSGLRALS